MEVFAVWFGPNFYLVDESFSIVCQPGEYIWGQVSVGMKYEYCFIIQAIKFFCLVIQFSKPSDHLPMIEHQKLNYYIYIWVDLSYSSKCN